MFFCVFISRLKKKNELQKKKKKKKWVRNKNAKGLLLYKMIVYSENIFSSIAYAFLSLKKTLFNADVLFRKVIQIYQILGERDCFVLVRFALYFLF